MTSELVKTCQSLIGVETCMHLTCTNMPAEKVDTALRVRNTVIHWVPCPSPVLSRRPAGVDPLPYAVCTITNLECLQEAKLHGCRNILALRGDPPAGQDTWTAVEGGFSHGIDLIRHIRKHHGDYFEIAIAGFPQHVTLPPEEFTLELQWLKEKVEAGASVIFTQMFYDVKLFIDWVKAVRKAGIMVPIILASTPFRPGTAS
jgi:methylenetetrahydrofolate reductase (NADPH)